MPRKRRPLRSLDLSARFHAGALGKRGWRALRVALSTATGLQSLKLAHQKAVDVLPPLPAGLEVLDLSSCSLAGVLAVGPKLKRLNAAHNRDVAGVDALPSGLEYLDLSFCTEVGELPPLPAGLRVLRVAGLAEAAPRELALPRLEVLDLSHCRLDALPAGLPPTLRELHAIDNPDMAVDLADAHLPHLCLLKLHRVGELSLPPRLDTLTALKELDVSSNEGLETLPSLPPGLELLSVMDCPALRALPPLPATLDALLMMNNHIVAEAELPASLKTLWLVNCLLARSVELPRALRALDLTDNRGVTLSVPLLKLEELALAGCMLAALPDVGRLCPALAALDVRDNPLLIDGAGLQPLPGLKQLQVDEEVEVPEGLFPGLG